MPVSTRLHNVSNENERAVLLELKEFKRGALFRMLVLEQEAMLLDSNLPSCHDLKKKILSTYIRLRLRIASKCIRAERKGGKKGILAARVRVRRQRRPNRPLHRQ